MYFETRPKPFYLGDIGDEEKVDDVFDEFHRFSLLHEIDEYEQPIPTISYFEICEYTKLVAFFFLHHAQSDYLERIH